MQSYGAYKQTIRRVGYFAASIRLNRRLDLQILYT